MERNVTWKIGITRTLTRAVEVTAESEEEALEIAKAQYGKAPLSTFNEPEDPRLSVKDCTQVKWDKLDELMVPHVMFNDSAITAPILKNLLDNKDNCPIPTSLIKKALATGAYWFRTRKGKNHTINKLDPIESLADAKSMGFTPYRIPAFPKKYAGKRKSLVGNQNFTYEELYKAWKGVMELTLNARDNEYLWYPCYLDLRSYPDDGWSHIECAADDIEGLCDQLTKYPCEISATCVDFYSNCIVTDSAEAEDGFHIQDGEID